MQNTSGMGSTAVVPPEIARWNWAAFGLNWIWAIGNRAYIGLLTLVPFVNLVMPFVLGAKGNAWAWRAKRWESVEHFQRTQRTWAIVTAGAYAAGIVVVALIVLGVSSAMKRGELYGFAEQTLRQDPRVAESIGVPFETGFVSGSYNVSGPSGSASFAIPLEGSRGEGTAYVEATRAAGTWTIERFEVEVDGRSDRIYLGEAAAGR